MRHPVGHSTSLPAPAGGWSSRSSRGPTMRRQPSSWAHWVSWVLCAAGSLGTLPASSQSTGYCPCLSFGCSSPPSLHQHLLRAGLSHVGGQSSARHHLNLSCCPTHKGTALPALPAFRQGHRGMLVCWPVSGRTPPPLLEHLPRAGGRTPPPLLEHLPRAGGRSPPPLLEHLPRAAGRTPPPLLEHLPRAGGRSPPPLLEHLPRAAGRTPHPLLEHLPRAAGPGPSTTMHEPMIACRGTTMSVPPVFCSVRPLPTYSRTRQIGWPCIPRPFQPYPY